MFSIVFFMMMMVIIVNYIRVLDINNCEINNIIIQKVDDLIRVEICID